MDEILHKLGQFEILNFEILRPELAYFLEQATRDLSHTLNSCIFNT